MKELLEWNGSTIGEAVGVLKRSRGTGMGGGAREEESMRGMKFGRWPDTQSKVTRLRHSYFAFAYRVNTLTKGTFTPPS
jgi:hypothetical protein